MPDIRIYGSREAHPYNERRS